MGRIHAVDALQLERRGVQFHRRLYPSVFGMVLYFNRNENHQECYDLMHVVVLIFRNDRILVSILNLRLHYINTYKLLITSKMQFFFNPST